MRAGEAAQWPKRATDSISRQNGDDKTGTVHLGEKICVLGKRLNGPSGRQTAFPGNALSPARGLAVTHRQVVSMAQTAPRADAFVPLSRESPTPRPSAGPDTAAPRRTRGTSEPNATPPVGTSSAGIPPHASGSPRCGRCRRRRKAASSPGSPATHGNPRHPAKFGLSPPNSVFRCGPVGSFEKVRRGFGKVKAPDCKSQSPE